MRVAIFDGILETHVAQSLERSLLGRGHTVLNTGKIGSGFFFPDDPEVLRFLNQELDRVLEFQPDVILVFRPASMPYALLRRVRASGALLAAWFSDDPVLWKLSYGPVVDFYDIVLHCGNAHVLRFYEAKHGRPTGINFPFWTDNVAFPYVYQSGPITSEAMFLGNVRGSVRAKRYADLAGLKSKVTLYGNIDDDPAGIWGGYADWDGEVIDAASRSLVGLSIPQIFRDHVGAQTWFEGLEQLSFFQYPSRVIQYAAMGLPIVSIVPEGKSLETFPEMYCATTPQEADLQIQSLVREVDLKAASIRTHDRFRRNYSADARVLTLEALLADDVDWRAMDASRRASLFLDYEAAVRNEEQELGRAASETIRIEVPSIEDQLRRHIANCPVSQQPLRIAVTGSGWTSETSDIATVVRALKRLGHQVDEINPYRLPECFAEDQDGRRRYMLQSGAYLALEDPSADVFVFVGDWASIGVKDAAALRDRGCELLHVGSAVKTVGLEEQRMAALMTYTAVSDPVVLKEFHALGLVNVGHMPKLIDRSYAEALLDEPFEPDAIGVLAGRRADLDAAGDMLEALEGRPRRVFTFNDGETHTLASLAQVCRTGKIISLPQTKSKNSATSPYIPYALVGGGISFTMRRAHPPLTGPSEQYFIAAQNREELVLKIKRSATGTWGAGVRSRGQQYGFSYFAAEERLSALLNKLPEM